MTARDHVPLRSRSSSRSTFSIASHAHRLTRRDFEILIQLYEHRVLTTPQIYELHFDTHTRASKRMLQLYRLGLVERFRPHTPTGSAPWHYTLDEPGARLVAARQEIDYDKFKFKKARIFDVVGSPRLRHRVECNGFFARLTLACRRRGWRLEWTGERRATASWNSVITPGRARPRGGGRPRDLVLLGVRPGDREPRPAGEQDLPIPHRRPDPSLGGRAAVRVPERDPGALRAERARRRKRPGRNDRPRRRAPPSARNRVAAAPR
jgi:predicted transcriptional regulator